MTSVGFVKELSETKAKVRFIRESACGGNCSSCGGCKTKPMDCWIENTLELSIGDKVEVESDSSKILKLAFILYILPLIVFIAVYIVFSSFLEGYIGTIIAVVFFFLSFLIAKRCGKNLNVEYRMVRKI